MGKKRILAAVDESPWAHQVVDYVSNTIDPERFEIVLFHVSTPIPESFWDVERNPAFRYRLAHVRSWEIAQKQIMEDFMSKAKKTLSDAGFPEQAVQVVIKRREVGIARDILFEAQKDYDIVVVGRRGVSDIKDLILGSVATKLLGRLSGAALWIVGEKVKPDGLLVAVDASDEALKAISFVASIMAGRPRRVLLLHVIRGIDEGARSVMRLFTPEDQKDWTQRTEAELERAVANIDAVFERAFSIFGSEGWQRELIQSKVVTGVASRAATIVKEARDHGYATIVVGRRGLSRVEEFFMGRVSNKVIQMAKERTVWVVN